MPSGSERGREWLYVYIARSSPMIYLHVSLSVVHLGKYPQNYDLSATLLPDMLRLSILHLTLQVHVLPIKYDWVKSVFSR